MDIKEIGELAVAAYKAKETRLSSKAARKSARETHPCDCKGNDYGYPNELCWQSDEPLEDWCDNCRGVQPIHLAYRDTAEASRKANYRLTATIKRAMK